MNILIIGHARHGKGTVCKFLNKHFDFLYEGSSEAAARLFIYDTFKNKYGYNSIKECYEDRVNHRAEWYNLIKDYNKYDKARLAKDILRDSSIYEGMRSHKEINECKRQNLFSLIIGVYDPRKPEEDKSSFDIDLWEESDLVIPNAEGLKELEKKVLKLKPMLK